MNRYSYISGWKKKPHPFPMSLDEFDRIMEKLTSYSISIVIEIVDTEGKTTSGHMNSYGKINGHRWDVLKINDVKFSFRNVHMFKRAWLGTDKGREIGI